MDIVQAYLDMTERVADVLELTVVSRIHVDTRQDFNHESSKFGALVLEDGTAVVASRARSRELRKRLEQAGD